MPAQAPSKPGARVRRAPDRAGAIGLLRPPLVGGRNADGGWGYYAGKGSRLEPTCWALLALGAGGTASAGHTAEGQGQTNLEPAFAWLVQCQQRSGWLLEDPQWPVNIAFNALAAFTLLHDRAPFSDQARQRLVAAVVASKGVSAPPHDLLRQDNSLQGWSWTDATFSWVEPTCWGLLALKHALGSGTPDVKAAARIVEGERLLVDRVCQPGGWNFGNASVMRQDLRPYVPTTALALLALQDRRGEPAVARALEYLEAHWDDEISATALGLSLLCLDVYGRPLDHVVTRLSDHTAAALRFGNHHDIAIALFALSSLGQPHAFRL